MSYDDEFADTHTHTPVTDEFKREFAEFNEQFDDAPEASSATEYSEIADGKYQATIKNVEITRSKKNNNPMVKWTLEILGGCFNGRLVWKYSMVSADHVKYLKQDITACGLRLVSFDTFPARCKELQGRRVEITLKKKGEFQGVYINGLLAGGKMAKAEIIFEANDDGIPPHTDADAPLPKRPDDDINIELDDDEPF